MERDTVLPKRRLNFSIAMKQQAVAWIRGPGAGSPARAAVHFRALNWEVSAETLEKWWRTRNKIMGSSDDKNAQYEKPARWALLSASQETALASVIRRRARKVRVSAKWIALAVRQMYPETTAPSFSVSKTWLLGFTQRHGLVLAGATVVLDQPQRRRSSLAGASGASSTASSMTAKKTQSARTMSLHDVLYEEKPVAATIAA